MLGREGSSLLFGIAADFSDHHDGFGLRVGLKGSEAINEPRTVHRISTDADAGRLPLADAHGLSHRLVRQGS